MTHIDPKDSFTQLGFCVIPDLLSPPELELAGELVGLLVRRFQTGEHGVVAAGVSLASAARRHPERSPGILAAEWENEPYIIGDLIELEPRFVRLFSAPAIWQCAAELLGCPEKDVIYHFSNITRKASGIGPAVGWHRDSDNAYFSAADCRTFRLLLPLQPMSEVNGGTSVVPGSHLLPVDGDVPDIAAPICPPVAPGSGLALHAEVLHGGSPNRSTVERDVLVLQFGVRSSELLYEAKEVLSLADREGFMQFNQDRTLEQI